MLGPKMRKRVCLACKRQFETGLRHKVYCSPKCAVAGRRQQNRQRMQANRKDPDYRETENERRRSHECSP